MNPLLRLFAAATLVLRASALGVHAQDVIPKLPDLPKPPPGRDPFLKERGAPASAPKTGEDLMAKMVIFETYTLGLEDAVGLLLSPPDAAARYKRVSDLVTAGSARLDNVIAGANKPGRRALVQSLDAIHRPTAWAPADAPNEPAVGAVMQQWGAQDRLEFESMLSADARSCNLNFSLVTARLLPWKSFRASPQVPPQPSATNEFCHLTSSVVMRTGEPVLLGTLSRPVVSQPDAKERTIVFARVQVIRQQPEAPPPEITTLGYCEHIVSFYSMDRAAAREILSNETKHGGLYTAVQSLLEKKQAKLEHVSSVLSQPGVRAKSEESLFARQPGNISPAPVIGGSQDQSKRLPDLVLSKNQVPSAAPYVRSVAGKDLGMSLEIESVIGPADALLKDVPLIVDLNLSLLWRADAGILKVPEGLPVLPEGGVIEIHGLDSSLSCCAGVPTFVGTLNPPRETGVNGRKDSGRAWLVFVRVAPAKQ
jgi:hypothetical protein